ncbi:MAG: DUF1638 domain-containing protein [Bilophila sp.]
MNTTAIIACEVLRKELEWIAGRLSDALPMHFLEQGLHDTPDTLRLQVQGLVDELETSAEPPDTILLGYGLCGRGLSGVTTRKAKLIIPKVHDCIPLLLGMEQDAASVCSQGGSTYWLSSGWIQCSSAFVENRNKRFADYEERFGTDSATYLMELEGSWLQHYTTVCLIRWNALEADEVAARRIAQDSNLPYSECTGNEFFLQDLLAGGKDERRFLHLVPGQTISLNGDGELVSIPV